MGLFNRKVPSRIWDNVEEIGVVQKSDYVNIHITATTRDNVRYVCLREFYFDNSEKIWKANSKGISLPILVPIKKGTERIYPLQTVLDLIEIAKERAVAMEATNIDNEVWYIPKVIQQESSQ